ncbi:cobalamin B12-binding domain-containing protein [Jeotgalibacillus terrae]|uniref:B12-binding domain-containing protein n=1 Tax=Jeotgalibacillus terrae TaxID=587735 RepID=A0ABW5ZMF3_9BACL|nr:cobalamin-dependent protein [Jeotgalibacillus terrae]MBM7580961.1 methanogenic corrinoid protein MtbC1 [Jeotgalibacillus terrae]
METVKNFTDVLLDGDQDKAWEYVINEVDKGTSTKDIFFGLLTPAMVEIGQKWQENEISVADEHLATTTCDFTLARYKHEVLLPRIQNKPQDQGRALFFCVEKEEHDLGIRMIAQIFEENGYEVRLMGANLPVEFVLTMAVKWEPDVIGMSASMLKQGERVPSYIQRLMERFEQTELLIGGRFLSLPDQLLDKADDSKVTIIQEGSELSAWMAARVEGGK